jgi:hypothetical protein
MNTIDQTTEICNALLRGEISAVETYTQASEKFTCSPKDDFLKRMCFDHEANADALRKIIWGVNAEASTTSGPWGGFVMAIEGAATLIGKSPALMILQQGEEHGVKVYKEALDNPEVSEDLKELIRDELLPSLNDHLIELQNRRNIIG